MANELADHVREKKAKGERGERISSGRRAEEVAK
jgi:hypothetical protein